MKLIDLEPSWLSPDLFIFRNPTGGIHWLTCKRKCMSFCDQAALVWEAHPELVTRPIVLTEPNMAWRINGDDFGAMTVFPSLDFHRSGDWHGFITNGEIR